MVWGYLPEVQRCGHSAPFKRIFSVIDKNTNIQQMGCMPHSLGTANSWQRVKLKRLKYDINDTFYMTHVMANLPIEYTETVSSM